jgi:capsular polysaccharide biosynthesis protein
VTNEDEITAWLVQHGFEVIYPEELSVAQQIALYSRATHVIAPGGAALTNMIFMPPGGWVLMLNNRHLPARAQHLYFTPMAKACGHHFRIVSGTPSRFATTRVVDADLIVPLQDVQRALAQA